MRQCLLTLLVLLAVLKMAGCGSGAQTNLSTTNDASTARPAASPSTQTQTNASNINTANDNLAVSPAHGARPSNVNAGAANPASEKPEIATAELDAKIAKLETKAKAKGAKDADKEATAAAYFERGMIYFNAQNPRLYKFALGDFRRTLRYEPTHREARANIDELERIYRSINKPIPTNGLEP